MKNADLTKTRETLSNEMENYKLKIYKNFWKYIKNAKVRKFRDIEIQKQKFSQTKETIEKNKDINKIIVSNKVSFCILLDTTMLKN